MPDVTLSYKGSIIAELDNSGDLSLKTAGKYCDADIELQYIKSGGGGTVVDSNKPVKFFDYDGTLVYSYTVAEFAELDAMPTNPLHEGLTAQGWNWTLADAKAYVATNGALIIGQHYVTTDGKTRVYIHLNRGRTSPYLGLLINGSATIDWGDGSTPDTVTGSNLTTNYDTQHNYPVEGGDFVITITVDSESQARIPGESSTSTTKPGSYLLWNTNTGNSTYLRNRVYQSAIRAVELGERIDLAHGAFRFCMGLEKISIPKILTNFSSCVFEECANLRFITVPDNILTYSGQFRYCRALQYIALPKSVPSASGSGNDYSETFYGCYALNTVTLPPSEIFANGAHDFLENCYGLTNLIIPEGYTKIGWEMCRSCQSLSSITIPASVTTIDNYSFHNCYGLGEVHFKASTPPTVSGSSAFSSLRTDCIIYVPYSQDHSVLADYQAATNYPSSSSYTYLEE